MRKPILLRFFFLGLLYLGSYLLFKQGDDGGFQDNPSPIIVNQESVPQQPQNIELKNLPTAQVETLIHEKINLYRESLALKPLKLDYRITNESRKYSAKMASGEAEFSHDGFDQRASNLEKQALEYESVAENLALLQGYEDLATVVVKGWIDSPGHHKNIIGDFELTGIGVVKNEEGVYYFTQLFLKRY